MSIGDAAFLLIFLGLHAQYFGMYVKRDWDGIDKSEHPQLHAVWQEFQVNDL